MNQRLWQTLSIFFLYVTVCLLNNDVCAAPPSSADPEQSFLVTYGSKAQSIEGDDDYLQIFFIQIPATQSEPLTLRIFDPDCGGNFDARYSRKWDTRTRFSVFGGDGAYSNPGVKNPTPDKADIYSGVRILQKEFGEDPSLDGRWYELSRLRPQDGERIGEFRYFKLVVEGVTGDDGNRFLIDVRPSDGAKLFTYAPTVHLSKPGVFAEMRFVVPEKNRRVTVHNFDLASATVSVDTAFRTSLRIRSSGQDQWEQTKIQLDEIEPGRLAALRFEGGKEMPNDATFYVTDEQGNPMPIHLPVYLWKPNARPIPNANIVVLDDCRSVQFDASNSYDPDGDPLQFQWNFGDGAQGQGVHITHTYSSPGQYDGYLIVEDRSGYVSNSALKRFSVTINQPPKADAGDDRMAAPSEKIVFDGSGSTDPDGKIIRYSWDFGDGERMEGLKTPQTVHAFHMPGCYQVTLTVEDNSNSPCRFASDTAEIRINAPPIAVINVHTTDDKGHGIEIKEGRIGGVSAFQILRFSGANSTDPDGTMIDFKWDFGDGSTENGIEVRHAYQQPGTYRLRLTVTDDSTVKNQTAWTEVIIIVNDPPVADAGPDQRVAVGESVVFNGSKSYDRDGKLIQFAWDFGDGTSEIRQEDNNQPIKIVHCYDQPGTYRVILTVIDDSGSLSHTGIDEAVVVVNAPPVADAGPDQRVTDSEVRFDGAGSHDPDGRIIRYAWNFGDGTSGEGVSLLHVYRTAGVYTVRLTVTDDSGTLSAQASDELTVIINQSPIADAGPDQIGVPKKPLQFDGSGSADPDGEIVSWHWDFGDGTEADGKIVSHSFNRPGIYTVLLRVQDDSGHEAAIGFDNAMVMINHPPIPVIQHPKIQEDFYVTAPNTDVVFDGSPSYDPDGRIVAAHWDFSDGKEFDSAKVIRRFAQSGIYTAMLTVTDNRRIENSVVSQKISIRVNHAPVAIAGRTIRSADRTVWMDASASSDADGDPLIHTWNFGDSTPEVVGVKVLHTYSKGGIYPVILSTDDGTGVSNSRSTSSITVIINQPPIANAGGNKTVCAGKVVIFDGSLSKDPEGGVMKYDWDFGDGSTAQGLNPSKVYYTGGLYPVTLTVTDDSGLDENNQSTDQIIVTVIESPVAVAGPNQNACAGTPVKFDGTKSKDVDGLVNRFYWDFGDGTTGGGPTPSHIYTKAGLYRVRLTITGDRLGDCDHTASDELTVTVQEAPVADFDVPLEAELGKSLQFQAIRPPNDRVNIMQWDWDFGDGLFGQGEKVRHLYSKSGHYVVTLTVTADSGNECNRTSAQKRLFINEAPVAVACPDTQRHRLAAIGESIVFNGSLSKDPDGVIVSWHWDFGDGETAEGIHVRHQYRSAGEYTVVLKVTDNTRLANNTSTDTMLITVNAPPHPVIDVAPTCAGNRTYLSASKSSDSDGEIVRYLWDFGDGTPSEDLKEVFHVYRNPGIYSVLLEVDDGRGLSNSRAWMSASVRVNAPPQADAGPTRIVSPGDEVVLDGSASYDPDGAIRLFQWTFGDGLQAQGVKVTHRYDRPGCYPVKLTVTDNSETECNTGTATSFIRVNAPPVANAGGSREVLFGGVHDEVIFDASGSDDPDNDPLTFYWDFGDSSTAQGVKVRHRFAKPGQYKVRLRVEDGTGTQSGTSWDEIIIRVKMRN